MEKILIGSSAIKHWFPDFPREPKDKDYIVGIPAMWNKEKGVEYLENDIIYMGPVEYLTENGVLKPDYLYTLKISHIICRDVDWDKHMFDIQWLKNKGCVLDKKLFYALYEQWGDMFGKNKRSELDMSAEEFFDNALTFPIPHDDLHDILIKHSHFEGQDKPTYNYVLKDGAEVDVSEEKFNLLSHKQKINLALEEVMVMALERWGSEIDYRKSYGKMLKKFILSHAPIWEALFIIENFVELHKAAFNFIKHIEEYGIRNIKESKFAY